MHGERVLYCLVKKSERCEECRKRQFIKQDVQCVSAATVSLSPTLLLFLYPILYTLSICLFVSLFFSLDFLPVPDMECGEEELDFNWDEYLEETGATAAAHTSFKHVSFDKRTAQKKKKLYAAKPCLLLHEHTHACTQD